jgi:hypothetical protein
MTSDHDQDNGSTLVQVTGDSALVTRTEVPSGLTYSDYRPYLRHDFFHSCAYCTMSEAEAQAIRFTIDHYEPRTARPELEHDYENLMYCCDECNTRKGNRCPPPDARKEGHRFFRPDHDSHSEHFAARGIRIDPRTNVGTYSIEALDLNRLSLRRLRDIRARLTACDRLVAEGVHALRRFHIDQLPQEVKGRAARTIGQFSAIADQLAADIDRVLRDYARSPLIDPDPEAEERSRDRAAKLQGIQALHPGTWRAPKRHGT